MTVPLGVPNLPQGALTLDTLAANLQNMTGSAMKSRAVERIPSIMNNSTGLNPASDITPLGILTRIFSEVQALIANADPADITGPGDIPELLVEFIEGLPVVQQLVGLVKAILGEYEGDDEMLLIIQDIFAPIRRFFQMITGITSGFPDVSDLLAGNASEFFNVTGITGSINGLVNTGQGIIDGIVNALGGLTGSLWHQSDANDALASQAAATASAAAAITAIQGSAGQNSNGGLNASVDFSDFPDSTNLPSMFTVTAAGGSAGSYGVVSGLAKTTANCSAGNTRVITGEYNVADTLTDYQRVCGIWTAKPGMAYSAYPTGPYYTHHYLYARYQDVNNWVRVDFSASNDATLQACVAGVVSTFDNVGHSFQPNTAYILEAGAPLVSDPYTFRVLAGGTPILTYPDAAHVSQVGAAFRGGSMGVSLRGVLGFGPAIKPGPMRYFALQDNSAAGVVGSGARVYRADTSGSASFTVTPDSFFDTLEYLTDEYTYDPLSGCRITVSVSDWYVVSVHLRFNGTGTASAAILRNGTTVRLGVAGSATSTMRTAVLYLEAGDYIQAGLSSSESCEGSADGTASELEITRVGKATAA